MDNNANNQINNSEGIVLSNDVQNAQTVENVQIPDNISNINNNQNEQKTKKKKNGFVKFLIVLIVLITLAAGGGYFYLKYMCTTDKFIDYNVESIKSSINSLFDHTVDFNILEDDYIGNGNLEISSTNSKYMYMNGLNLNYNIGTSLSNNYISFKGDLVQEDAKLSGTVFIDKENLYFDSEDIFPLLLSYNLGKDYLVDIKKELEDSNDMSIDDAKNMLNNIISYFGEALKEVDSDVTIDGMYLKYRFNFYDDNYEKFDKKLTELLLDDEQFKEFKEKYNQIEEMRKSTSYDDNANYKKVYNLEVIIKVNPLTKEVETFSLIDDGTEINGVRTDKNKYRITSDKTIIDAEITNNKIAFDISNDTKSIGSFIATIDDKKISLSVDLTYENEKMEINFDITKESSNETKSNLMLSYDGVVIKNSLDDKFGKSILTKENVADSREFDQLSDEAKNYFLNNFQEKISQFKFYKDFYSTNL